MRRAGDGSLWLGVVPHTLASRSSCPQITGGSNETVEGDVPMAVEIKIADLLI